jgi:hypothetical protein
LEVAKLCRDGAGSYRFLRPPFEVFLELEDDFRLAFAAPRPPLAAPRLLFAAPRPPFAAARPPLLDLEPPFAALRPPVAAFREEPLVLRDAVALLRVVLRPEPADFLALPADAAGPAVSVVICAISPAGAPVSGIRTSLFG